MNNLKITLTNYEFEIPANWNIVVIANYRTGSTAFCDRLSQITGLPFLGELFHFNLKSRPGEYNPEQPSIIKIMPNHMPPEEHWESLFNGSYMIGLDRADFAAQVLSFAIAHQLGRWQQEKEKKFILEQPELTLPNRLLMLRVKEMRKTHNEWLKCQPFFDLTVQYEQLLPDLAKSKYDAMPKISNYEDRLEYIRSIL